MLLLAGNANRPLAVRVAAELRIELGLVEISTQADGETSVCIDSPLGGVDVYIIQPLAPPANQHLFEVLLLANACRRGHAARITLIAPYLAYTRQERLSQPGTAIATQLLATLLAAAQIDRVVTLDLHNHASVGLFTQPFYHLSSVSLYQPLLKDYDDLLVVAPDYGGKLRAQMLGQTLACDYLCIDKRCDKQEYLQVNNALAVQGRDCVLYDDICVSGRTLLWAQELLQQQGAKSISVLVTHALFSAAVTTQLIESPLRLFACTNSVLAVANAEAKRQQPHTVSIAGMLAQTISALHRGIELPTGVLSYA